MLTFLNQEQPRNTFVCQGIDFICEADVDFHNSQFEPIQQAMECATRVIEQKLGEPKGLLIQSNNDSKLLESKNIILCYLKGTSPETGFIFLMQEILANAGYYKESIQADIETRIEIQKRIETEAKLLAEAEQALKSVKSKPKKPRKKYTRKPKKST